MSLITQHNQRGFTIIELMIATTVFSVVLLICSFAMLQIGRTYYKGIAMSRTQTVSRSIMDEVSQAIQFSGGTPIASSGGLCVDTIFYAFNQAAGSLNKHVLGSSCTTIPPPSPLPTPVNMLGNNMRLGKFDINNIPGTSLYEIEIRVVYGDNDVLTNPPPAPPAPLDLDTAQCRDTRSGGHFCAISELSTVVQKRL